MAKEVDLGLRANWGQFTLLVIVNAFVGGMVGLERSILPQIAEAEFQIAARTSPWPPPSSSNSECTPADPEHAAARNHLSALKKRPRSNLGRF